MEIMTWWGETHLDPGQRGVWTIGALSLWLERLGAEWRLAYVTGDDPLATDAALEVPSDREPPAEEAEVLRLAGVPRAGAVLVRPRLADRTIVARPEEPVTLAPGREVVLYVSTPAWVELEVDGVTLADLPSYRPSDTWFGATPMKGVLCYASRTSARLSLEGVPLRGSRAVTHVLVRNRGRDPLRIRRINLPVPNLALFAGPRGFLWTEDVSIERTEGGDMARILIASGVPSNAPEAIRIGEARDVIQENILSRALHALMN